jgi:hypothetical protein
VSERLLELLVDESKWLSAAMLLAALAVVAWGLRRRERTWDRWATLASLDLFYGVLIGVMAGGHLLAVGIVHARGTLAGSPWLLYPLGLALAVPAWGLVLGAPRLATGAPSARLRARILDAWLGSALLLLGLHNLPLAFPALLHLAYPFHAGRPLGRTIVGVALVLYLALFAGSLVFLASGQSFEQFSDA